MAYIGGDLFGVIHFGGFGILLNAYHRYFPFTFDKFWPIAFLKNIRSSTFMH